MIIPVLEGLTLTKGHAGGNDAVIFPDLDASRTITAHDAAQICHRTQGIGAGALMRVVRTGNEPDAGQWRVDGWNPDGTPWDDPGPYLRLAAHYLRVSGLVDLPDGDSLSFAVGSSVRHITRTGDGYAGMMELALPASDESVRRGFDVAVSVDGVDGVRGGLTVRSTRRTGIVVALEHADELKAATGGAQFDPDVREADLVLVVPEGDQPFIDFDGVERAATRFSIRSFTGGQEVVSCDRGVRDAAVALYAWAGENASGIYHADSGGIRTEIRFTGGDVELAGGADIVAEFQLTGIAGEGR